MRFLLSSLLLFSVLLSSSLAHSAISHFPPDITTKNSGNDRFAKCHKYDDLFRKSVRMYWPQDFQYPTLWKAQIFQESLCDQTAISPAGAKGLAQFVDGTWFETSKKLDYNGSPFGKYAIIAGGYYMSTRFKAWPSERTQYQRWQLAAACYNAGCGNIYKAQKSCGNTPLWDIMKHCLFLHTGKHAKETITYLERIPKWAIEMSEKTPWELPPELLAQHHDKFIATAVLKFKVRRYFSGNAWGTYWQIWGGWITANHVHNEMFGAQPPFIRQKPVRKPDRIDAVYYGNQFPTKRPRAPRIGETVYIIGYPGGSDKPSLRIGRVYYKRKTSGNENYSHLDTIIVIETPQKYTQSAAYDPVIGGMSGGLVMSTSFEPLGVLISQNSPTDLTGNGIADQSADFVPLRDIWTELRQ